VAGSVAYASTRGRWVLLSTVLGSGLAQLDGTVVNVALPRIGTDLHAGLTSLQWTLNAYALVLSGLLLLGGSLGDKLGRRRIFVIGVVWFTIASVLCGAAPTATVLVLMRGLQGVGAALLTPGSLAILQTVFRRQDRARAVGAWSGLAGVAAAIGPVLGGALIGIAPWGWRLVFLINIPLAIVIVFTAQRYIPETRDEQSSGTIDWVGAVLACLGLGGLVYGLTEGPAQGWPLPAVLATVGGVLILIGFVFFERAHPDPLLPLSLFSVRQFTAANLVTFAVYGALAGGLFLLPVELQLVSGFSPLEAGSALLPLTAVMLLLSARGGALAQRIGPRWPMTIGPIITGIGIALFAGLRAHSSYFGGVFPAVLVFSLGLAVSVAPLTSAVLAAAPDHQTGVASAVNNAIGRGAGLLAVAVLPALAGITPAAYADPVLLLAGFHRAVLIAGALCALGGVMAFFTISDDCRPISAAPPQESLRGGAAAGSDKCP